MSGNRQTPYKFGNRVGPNMAEVVAKYPQHCRVHYRGHWYKFMRCAWSECPHPEGFWRRYGGNFQSGLGSPNPKQSYCSETCASNSARKQRQARQRRWAAKNPDRLLAYQSAYHKAKRQSS